LFNKLPLVALIIGGLVAAAAVTSARLSAAPASSRTSRSTALLTLPRAAAPGQTTVYGDIVSLTRKGKHFEVHFDPAWFLTGVTAQRRAEQDGYVRPGEAVPNDYYVLDESHRLLTYIVPTGAHVTILTAGTNTNVTTVAGLAQRVRTRATNGRGFWILVGKWPNHVLSLDQQYHP
jgi:hypothetical protein